jgi:hypothetical protein
MIPHPRNWASNQDHAEEWLNGESLQILKAIKRGVDPFNEDGTLNRQSNKHSYFYETSDH